MADPDLALVKGWLGEGVGGFVLLALPAFLPSKFSFFAQNALP